MRLSRDSIALLLILCLVAIVGTERQTSTSAPGLQAANVTSSIATGNVTDRNRNITISNNDTIGLLNDVDMLKEFIDVDIEQTAKILPNITAENNIQREGFAASSLDNSPFELAASDPLATAVAAAEFLAQQQNSFESNAGEQDDTKRAVDAKTWFGKEGYGENKKKHHKDDSHSDDDDKKHKGINSLAFLYKVANRTLLCSVLNGTCVTPTACPYASLAYLGLFSGGYGHGGKHGKHDKLHNGNFDCNLTTICCYPYLFSGLFNFGFGKYGHDHGSHHGSSEKHSEEHSDEHSSEHSDDEHDSHGYEHSDQHSVEPYGYNYQPSNSYQAPSGYGDTGGGEGYGHGYAPPAEYPQHHPTTYHSPPSYHRRSYRRRRTYRRERRRRRRERRRSRSRRSKHSSGFHDLFGLSETNRTALCLLRSGVCVSPSECATNSAVLPHHYHDAGHGSHGDSSDSHEIGYHSGHQIKSFLCNFTSICCLPHTSVYGTGQVKTKSHWLHYALRYFPVTEAGGFGFGYGGIFGSSFGKQAPPTGRELTSSQENIGQRRSRARRRRATSFPVTTLAISDTDRTALCISSNGTCVSPSSCNNPQSAASGLSAIGGAREGFGGGGQFYDSYSAQQFGFYCNLTSLCCLPNQQSISRLLELTAALQLNASSNHATSQSTQQQRPSLIT